MLGTFWTASENHDDLHDSKPLPTSLARDPPVPTSLLRFAGM